MIDLSQTELSIGFSEAERDELENLIKAMRQEESCSAKDPALEHVQLRMKTLMRQVSSLSELILKYDTRMKSLYEIIRLLYEKSNKMNEQINFILRTIKFKGYERRGGS